MMTSFALLLFSLAILALVSLFGGCRSRRRYLIDSYGLDIIKLKALSCLELKELHDKVHALQKHEDAIAISTLLKFYRA
ncbi:hypothetical protein ICN18_01320 [Polynucleobacter sp. Ross1-W9]|jgi:hypothetical protein|uniref:hypothetical protein n=1 Tax=Polynucleobacter parvulilacunae TaxID=1855631 RepID=UPI001C0C312D|nr:hypothetical protein [Polynucleobacter parvulilacunae]MBU3556266.1 hypothetical protein [Polynucleobacter parvulilacunae]